PHEHSCSLSYAQWLNQIHPEQRQLVDQQLQQAIATHTDYAVEYKLITPDNSINWVLAKGRGVYDSNGKLLRMLGVIINITERKLAEAEQRRAEVLQGELQLLEDILETAQVGYWEWQLVENQGYFSPTLKRMLGYETHELANPSRDWEYLMFEEDLPEFLDSFNQHFQNCSDSPYFQELRYRHKDGTAVWAICSGRVIEWDKNGQPLRMIGSNIDITKRKQTEAELLAVTNLQQAILDGSDYAIIYNNANGIQTFNAAAQKMLGYTAEEVVGRRPAFFHDLEEIKQRAAELSREIGREVAPGTEFFTIVTQNGKTYEKEWTYIRKDGSRFPVLLSIKILHDLDGKDIGFLGIAKDISQQKQIEIALKESEHRYETLAQAAPVAIFRLDNYGNCNYVNDRWANLSGKPKQAALGTGWLEAIHPEDRDRILTEWLEANLGTKGLFSNEGRHLRPDGSISWFHCYISPETNFNGAVIGYIGTLTDITIRKQAEEALTKYAHEVEDLYNNAPCGYHSLNAQGRFIKVNETELQWLGYTREEMIGQPIAKFFTPASCLAFEYNYPRFQTQGWLNDFEFEMICKDGTILPVLISATAVKDAQGNYSYSRSTLFDIRERKQVEQKLEESRTMLQLVMDTFPQRVFWKDRQSRFLGCNRAFLRDSQVTIEQILGKSDFELPWAKWAHLYYADDAMVMATGKPKLNYEEPLIGPNGEEIWLRTNKVPLTNSAGEVIGVLVSHEDITERKLAEVQLRQTNEQLAHTNV
ncbi:PAS domain-containing protein, partial [Nostoc sp. FACHB-110]|uniref:PAS domain-containing protein n=1 Tax=Nostoc sp. FACHB-110 TaxID=2692834 RepID=UPI00168508AF